MMLIYARNQTFCSKSVNKAPKMLIFGLNTLCGILSNCTWKNAGIKINFLYLLFMNFLCIFFFYLLFLLFFSAKFVADTFWSTIMLKQINFAIESKNKHIYMNYAKKTQFALILYTKSHFGAIFGPTCMYKKLRTCNFRIVPPGITNLVSKCAGNSKEKVIKCRG